MPTKKPRAIVTFRSEADYQIFRELASLQHVSLSSVISGLVESVAPSFGRVVTILRSGVEAGEEATRRLRTIAEESERWVLPVIDAHQQSLLDTLEMAAGLREAVRATERPSERSAERGGRITPPTNRGVNSSTSGKKQVQNAPNQAKKGKNEPTLRPAPKLENIEKKVVLKRAKKAVA